MPPFLALHGREFYHLALERPGPFTLPFAPGPYPSLIWDHGGNWTDPEREAFVSALLLTDCRYAVCGGSECERWHDDIDLLFVRDVPEAESDARFMMTTWHTDEAALEVAWFFAWNTNFEQHDFRRFLVLELGLTAPSRLLTDAVGHAVTDPEGAIDEFSGDAG